jgi:RimJ/RimL family protein N-acetyltransferase
MPCAVRLRDVVASDLPIFFEHQRDPDATRMAAFPARDWEAFHAHWTRILNDDAVTNQTILCDGEVAGNIVCFDQDGRPHVGYWFWGQGVATNALLAFLERVLTRPLYARVANHNVASLRVLAKCGFTVCGETSGAAGADGEEVAEVVLELR